MRAVTPSPARGRAWPRTTVDNENTVTTSQDITVLDEMAPQFTGTCDIANDEAGGVRLR